MGAPYADFIAEYEGFLCFVKLIGTGLILVRIELFFPLNFSSSGLTTIRDVNLVTK